MTSSQEKISKELSGKGVSSFIKDSKLYAVGFDSKPVCIQRWTFARLESWLFSQKVNQLEK